MKKPCVHWPYPPSHSRLGWNPPMGYLETAENALLGAAFCKGKLCSVNKPQPHAAWLRIPALA